LAFVTAGQSMGGLTFPASAVSGGSGASIHATARELGYRDAAMTAGFGFRILLRPVKLFCVGVLAQVAADLQGPAPSPSSAAVSTQPGGATFLNVGLDAGPVLALAEGVELRPGLAFGLRAVGISLHAPAYETTRLGDPLQVPRPTEAAAADFFLRPHTMVVHHLTSWLSATLDAGLELAFADLRAPGWVFGAGLSVP
jgi:hypothetical protein